MTPPLLFQWIRQAGERQKTVHPLAAYPRTAIVEETAFAQIFRLERRRAERSGKKLMLVLISTQDFQGKRGRNVANRVATSISGCVRETDVLGWHLRDAALGILMTESGNLDDAAVQSIMVKITQKLKNSLSPEQFQRVDLRYELYPHTEEHKPEDRRPGIPFRDHRDRRSIHVHARVTKRLMDICGSCAALILLAPVFLAIGVLVKCTSKGPVFFCQKRVGSRGRLFPFFKFRTMFVNCDSAIHREYVTKLIAGGSSADLGGGLYKLARDPRITPVGRWLRKTSLDELPQFANVLLGHMSLVGPRPPLPYEFERYKPWHKRRVLEMKPGLTGPWQIGGRSTTTFDEMVRMDLRYLRSKSFLTDCAILLKTPAAVISGRGAC